MARKFINWIKEQKDRNDPIGDLARDLIVDRDLPEIVTGYRSFKRYLVGRSAVDGALNALDMAWGEYKKQTK